MRISIITVFNSNNPGSYWQARALYESVAEVLPGGLEKNEIKFYDAEIRKLGNDYLLACVKNILFAKFHKAGFIYRNHKAICKCWKSLPNTRSLDWVNKSEIVIFGSDEIWNFDRKAIRDYPILAGKGISGPKKIAIAVSAGNTRANFMKSYGLTGFLEDFSYISVRDSETKRAVEECTCLPVEIICDPTLVKPADFYPCVKRTLKNKYIALYGLDVSEQHISLIQEISAEMKLPVISLARWYDFCEDSVADESVFSYYKNAEAVICMTFHGTAFAINFEKPFVVLSCGKKKIKKLLEEMGLEERCIDNMSGKEAAELLNKKDIDYFYARCELEKKRQQFKIELARALGY